MGCLAVVLQCSGSDSIGLAAGLSTFLPVVCHPVGVAGRGPSFVLCPMQDRATLSNGVASGYERRCVGSDNTNAARVASSLAGRICRIVYTGFR